MSGECGSCQENFVVNSKSIKCFSCSFDFHTKCVQLKDSALKVYSESKNICFFCNNCLEEVKSKLGQKPEEAKDAEADNDLLEVMIAKHTEVIVRDMEIKFNVINNELKALKDSNMDLVRLMSSEEFRNSRTSRPEIIANDANESSTKRPIPFSMNSKLRASRKVKIVSQDDHSNKKEVTTAIDEKTLQQAKAVTPRQPTGGNPAVYGKGRPVEYIKPAPKARKWIWIGGLSRETSASNMLSYAKEKWPKNDLLCFDLKSKSSKKSFKMGSSDLEVEKLLDPEEWPEGILLRPFQHTY